MKELIIIGGANGSGKTTFSKQILLETGYPFLNADEIEKELAISKLQAGKTFFIRLQKFIDAGESFVLESTLSGNYLMNVIEKATESGYSVKIVYIFLETPKDCIQRIRIRVTLGGHSIPDEDVIRRYYRSKINFWNDYKNLATEWVMIHNSITRIPQRVVIGSYENYFVEEENLFDNFIKDI
jgi:predicted ABC-type ATPase